MKTEIKVFPLYYSILIDTKLHDWQQDFFPEKIQNGSRQSFEEKNNWWNKNAILLALHYVIVGVAWASISSIYRSKPHGIFVT